MFSGFEHLLNDGIPDDGVKEVMSKYMDTSTSAIIRDKKLRSSHEEIKYRNRNISNKR